MNIMERYTRMASTPLTVTGTSDHICPLSVHCTSASTYTIFTDLFLCVRVCSLCLDGFIACERSEDIDCEPEDTTDGIYAQHNY